MQKLYSQGKTQAAAPEEAGGILGYLRTSLGVASPSSVAHGSSAHSLRFQVIHYLVAAIGRLHFDCRSRFLFVEQKAKCERSLNVTRNGDSKISKYAALNIR